MCPSLHLVIFVCSFLLRLENVHLLLKFEKRKKDFQDGHQGGPLGLPISMVLAIFDLQVTLMLPTKFGFSWPFGSGEEAKNRFSKWPPWWPSWISVWNDFSVF